MADQYAGDKVAKLRRYVWANYPHRCHWCNRILETFESMTVEHLVPRSKGGTHALDNLRPACGPCNFSRGNREKPGPYRRVRNESFFKI